MNEKTLNETARGMVASGRGILAADESTSTIGKRFDGIKVENTEENRRAYRDMLFTAPGVEKNTSGVIFYDETLFQKSADGTPFPKLLAAKGIIPGIKVDTGAKPARASPSGARSSRSAAARPATTPCTRMPRPSRATPRCARKTTSSPSSSPKC